MGTHADRILALLAQSADLDDDEIARALKIEPRQTVNQTCRMLAGRGLLIRETGTRGKIVNRLAVRAIDAAVKFPDGRNDTRASEL